MSSDLERRLEGFLRTAPDPELGVGEHALARAVAAVQPAAPSHRRFRTAVLAFAAFVVLLVVAAGSLAAAGALHVSFGKTHRTQAAVAELSLPHGANGVAVVLDGRLSVVTKSGFRLQGLPVTAAALSPHALYVAAGVGQSLVALRPDGSHAWSHPTGGTVVAIAWAPDGFRIAYLVRTGHRVALHVIYGNGLHDTVIDGGVRAVRPSWRSDSLAFAYVGAGGKAIVYDLFHDRRTVARSSASDVTWLAFAPRGSALALASSKGTWLVGAGTRASFGYGATGGLAWLRPGLLLVGTAEAVAPTPIGILPAYRPLQVGGVVLALATGEQQFIAGVGGHAPRIVLGTGTSVRTILRLHAGMRIDSVAIG